ncbi:MAG: hypothetical protein K6F99_04655 [Lachnospiraceae bacterium]|nr:hypothetical protein [Lachnospiraceae bacterium]
MDLDLYLKLSGYSQKGVKLYMNNQLATAEQIVRKMSMKEDVDYMADIIDDENGRIRQIRYDPVIRN